MISSACSAAISRNRQWRAMSRVAAVPRIWHRSPQRRDQLARMRVPRIRIMYAASKSPDRTNVRPPHRRTPRPASAEAIPVVSVAQAKKAKRFFHFPCPGSPHSAGARAARRLQDASASVLCMWRQRRDARLVTFNGAALQFVDQVLLVMLLDENPERVLAEQRFWRQGQRHSLTVSGIADSL